MDLVLRPSATTSWPCLRRFSQKTKARHAMIGPSFLWTSIFVRRSLYSWLRCSI